MGTLNKSLIAVTIASLLSACGGGGSGSDNSTAQPAPPTPVNNAPTVSIENVSVNELETVTLTANASDGDGDSLTYSWAQTTGETISFTENGSFITFDAPEVTTNTEFTFEVTVADGADSSTSSSTVTVSNVNKQPVVTVSDNITVNELTEVTLTATANDSDGDELSYSWTQTSGDAIAFINNGESITFTAPEVVEGIDISFEVSVSDGTDIVEASSVVTILNVEITTEEAYTQLYSVFDEVVGIIEDNAENSLKDKNYEPVGWYNTYSIDVHNDGDMDVLIASVTHVDHVNRKHIQGEAYLIVNENNEYFYPQATGLFSHGRTLEIFDMNGDGLDDVYFADHGYEGGAHPYPGGQDQYWLQIEDGTFENMTHILPSVLDYTHGSCLGNFIPNKSRPDIVVTGGSAKYQYNNNGTIVEQTDRLELLAKNMDGSARAGLIDIPSMWCLGVDLNGDELDDIIFPGNVNQGWWDEKGNDISGKHILSFNNGNGYFYAEDVEYIDIPMIEYEQKVGHEFMHTTGMFKVQLDGDNCADFVIYNSNYGDYESFTTYTNTCDKGIEITNVYQQEFEQLCEHIDIGNNQIVAWCGSTIYRPKLITFEKEITTIDELTKQGVYQLLKPADSLKVRRFFE